MTEPKYMAAWVPTEEMPDLEQAAEMAAAWLLEQSRELGAQPLLVLPDARARSSGPEIIRRLAAHYPSTTTRTRGGEPGSAVLALHTDYAGLDLASQRARGAALVVVEHPTDPLIGWAMQRRALNLVTGEPTPDSRPPAMVRLLEQLHQCGNNGWTTSFDKQVVPRILNEMREAGLLDRELVLGYMLARGHSASSIRNLAASMDRL